MSITVEIDWGRNRGSGWLTTIEIYRKICLENVLTVLWSAPD